jgi:hypothetical protein
MPILTLILLLLAFASFTGAAANAPTRINLIALGLACWVLVALLGRVQP